MGTDCISCHADNHEINKRKCGICSHLCDAGRAAVATHQCWLGLHVEGWLTVTVLCYRQERRNPDAAAWLGLPGYEREHHIWGVLLRFRASLDLAQTMPGSCGMPTRCYGHEPLANLFHSCQC